MTPVVVDRVEHVHPNFREGWTGPADSSVEFRALVSGESLYLAFVVRDDRRMHESDRAWWVGDSIELFFDTDLGDDGAYSDDDRQLFLLPFHEGLRWGVVARGPNAPYPDGGLRGIEMAHTEQPEGYTVEARIPLFNLTPYRPNAAGEIGFDFAINDVDTEGTTATESYLTLSGRFDLYGKPSHFGRLAIGALPAAPAAAADPPPAVPLGLLLFGLGAAALLAIGARRASRLVRRRTRLRAATIAATLAAGAAVCSFVPLVGTLLERRLVRGDFAAEIDRATQVVRTYLEQEASAERDQATRLTTLLHEGEVRIRPSYHYRFVPLHDEEAANRPVNYRIDLEAGEARRFPLAEMPAPERLRLRLQVPEGDERAAGAPVATIRLEFAADREPLEQTLAANESEWTAELADRAGTPLRALTIRNTDSHRRLVVQSLAGSRADTWRLLPLAVVTRSGVPLDVWRDSPATHILPVAAERTRAIPAAGATGHRLWVALGTRGAYPSSPYGVPAVALRVVYRDGAAGADVRLRNGSDVQDALVGYTRPGELALEWETGIRTPVHYTLHSLPLDPARPLDRIEVTDLGVLASLRVAAATVGARASAALPADAPVFSIRDRMQLRPEVREAWRGFGFTAHAPDGSAASAGPAQGVVAERRVRLADGQEATLEVRLPHRGWAHALRAGQPLFFGAAALLAALAAVLLGAAVLHRARRLRVKMSAALGAATLVPLVFLVVALTALLNERAESELREATLADLRRMRERIHAARIRARELATRARDAIEQAIPRGGPALEELVARTRDELADRNAFLRVPDGAGQRPSPFGNTTLIDALRRSGIYYSPWDGIVALGLTRSPANRRYLVGLRGDALLGEAPAGDAAAALFGPRGDRVAASRDGIPSLTTAEELATASEPRYAARAAVAGEPFAAAHELLRDGDRVVGILGVYRSRVGTEAAKAGILRTLLLSGLAALLLVVLAGGTLVDSVTGRLQRVSRAADAIAEGNLESRVPVEGEDEVGRMATSFNTMADALDARVRQLTELHRGMHELTAALDRREVARAAAALLRRATGAAQVTIAALDPASERLESLEGPPLAARLPARGPLRDAVERQEPVVREGRIHLPLVAAGRPVGVAACAAVGPGAHLDREFLDASGRQIGIALENARLYRAAVTDERTGLYTLPYFTRRLTEEVDRASATGRPLALLRIVLDDYRTLAQRHGPAVATRLVAETAATISGGLPPRNIVAGREPGELLVLLVEADQEEARRLLDRAATALERHEFGAAARPAITYGHVHYPDDGASAEILLDRLSGSVGAWEEGATGGPVLHVPPDAGILVGTGPTMRATLDVVARVAPTNATVLLSGETGTGKEVLATLLQANSTRRDRAYVRVNCAAIPESLLESELFGHERGAFTGAERQRIGRFEQAHGGTLFLDEIGEVSLSMQVKLLRVLQERRLRRVGGEKAIDVDVRIVAATNRDLTAAVRAGEFREDLYHRLHVVELRVPPLRERRDEIPRLVDHFRLEFNRRHGLAIASFAPDAVDALYHHAWPGNVRELKNVVERAMLLAPGDTVDRGLVALPAAARRDPAPAGAVDGLSPRQERILTLARSEGGVTNGDIVSRESVSARTALRELQRLVERRLLVRVGRRRGAVYRPAEVDSSSNAVS